MKDQLKELEKEYYELVRSPIISDIKPTNPKAWAVKVKDVKSDSHHPIDIRERVDWIERRIEDFERTLVLFNKNLDEHRKMVNERLDAIENQNASEKIKNEILSLKTLVEKTMEVNEEIKTKTPVFIRELEDKINNVNEDLKKIKEENKEEHWSKPIILE